jgi:hypothetical protein
MDKQRSNERGSARLKFLVVVLFLAAVGYAGYLYIPIAYQAYLFKDLMQHEADVAAANGYQPTWVSDQLKKSLAEYSIPADAVITPVMKDSRIEVRVQYTRVVPFPGYPYAYEFDNTVKSTAFLTFK